MNLTMHFTLLDVATSNQEQLARNAEHARLIAEASQGRDRSMIGGLRLHVGRAIVATGRRVQGRGARPDAEEADGNPALNPAR